MIELNEKQKQNIRNYIISCIHPEYAGEWVETPKEKLELLIKIFNKENKIKERCQGTTFLNQFINWIIWRGRSTIFQIDLNPNKVLKLARNWKILEEDATKEEKEELQGEWLLRIAYETFDFAMDLNIDF